MWETKFHTHTKQGDGMVLCVFYSVTCSNGGRDDARLVGSIPWSYYIMLLISSIMRVKF